MITSIADTSQVAEARRRVDACARNLALPAQRAAQVALVVTELATNLLKHGGGGEILARPFDDLDGVGLEVLALDRGRGMDVERCLRDGYSTAGSPGNGLGAIMRQSDLLRIYSRPEKGTAIMARFVTRAPAPSVSRTQIGAAVAPYPGETLCGDAWEFAHPKAGPSLLVVDGSGHGHEAARAAELATQTFRDHAEETSERLIERIHHALAPTRGAAIALARVDAATSNVGYVGIGNITGAVISDAGTRRMISHNGTAGHIAPRIREFTYPFVGTPLVILHSDGVTARWDLASYPGLASQHPSLIAGVLLRDFRRGRDDASVVAIRTMV